MYTLAGGSFHSLPARSRLGPYAPLSEIKLADSYYFNREYTEAAKRYEDFAKNYPGSADIPYVKLQAAKSYLSGSRGAGRDRSPLEKALTLLDEVVTTYPTSPYAAVA